MAEERKYCAFISYRHKDLDKSVAKKIHSMIERYTIPKEMRAEWGGKRLGKVFRDEEELPVSSNLTDSITTALDHSDYLIVICTPNTPESEWVEREITYFLEHHDRSHVIAVLVDGTPETSFPKHLTADFDEEGNVIAIYEPLAANLTGVDHKYQKNRLKKESVRLYSAIMGCPFDSLWQRERRQKMRRLIVLFAVFLVLVLGYCITMGIQYARIRELADEVIAQNKTLDEKQLELTKTNLEISNQNLQISSQKKELEQQNRELKEKEAETLLREGELLYERGDLESAKKNAVAAISSEEGRNKYADEAQYLLSRCFGTASYDNTMRTTAVAEQEDDVSGMILSGDGKSLYTMDSRGYVRCFSTSDGSLLWKGDSKSRATHVYIADRDRMMELKEYGILLCMNEDAVAAISLTDGSPVWDYTFEEEIGADFCVVSEDHSRVCLIDNGFSIDRDYEAKALLLNSADGTVIKEVKIGDFLEKKNFCSIGRISGLFRPDGERVIGWVYGNDNLLSYDSTILFEIDFAKGSLNLIRKTEAPEEKRFVENYSFLIGMEYLDSEEDPFVNVFYYDAWEEKIIAEQIRLDGEILGGYEYILKVPSIDEAGSYHSTYHRRGDMVQFSCWKVVFVYDLQKQKFSDIRYGFTDDILYSDLVGDDLSCAVALAQNGRHYVYWNEGGKGIYDFSDKTRIESLTITDGYALNSGDNFGFRMNQNAVEAIILMGDLKKIYLLKPDQDPEMENCEWYEKWSQPSHECITRLVELPSGKMALMIDAGNEVVNLVIINPKTGEILEEYQIDTEQSDLLPSVNNFIKNSYLWPDEKHISYVDQECARVYDLEQQTTTDLFENPYFRSYSFAVLKNGEVLSAVLADSTDPELAGEGSEVQWVIGGGSIQKTAIPKGLSPVFLDTKTYQSTLFCGENGMILVPITSEDRENKTSYLTINTADGSSKLVERTQGFFCQEILAFAKTSPLFIPNDLQNGLLICDCFSGEVKATIGLPVLAEDVASVEFILNDTALAVWTKSCCLYVYDANNGSLLYEGKLWGSHGSAKGISLEIYEDSSRDLIFFASSDHAVVKLNSKSWNTLAQFNGMDGYSSETGEIYRLNSSGMTMIEEMTRLMKVKEYTLDELKQKVLEAE